MQHRTLTFAASLLHAQYYAMLYKALAERGGSPGRPSREDLLAERRLLTAFQAAGTPVGDPPEFIPGDPPGFDARFYTLTAQGGTVQIRQKPDFALLERYLEQTPFQAGLTGILLDLEDWLSAAPKSDTEETP